MIDQFGRDITYLRISLTDRCNFKCLYCMPGDPLDRLSRDEILSFDEIVKIVEGATTVGINKFRLTGGEPLVRKGVPELVGMINQVRGVQSTVMTTNAALLREHAQALYDGGLERLNISIDSLREDRFREITKGGQLGPVLEGIDAALAAGFQGTKLNAVIMRGFNEDEIEDLVAFARNKNLELRFLERMPFNSAHDNWDEAFMPVSEIYDRVSRIEGLIPEEPDRTGGPAMMYRFEDIGCRIGFIGALSEPYCERCNRLRVSSIGTIRSCLVDGGELDLRQAIRNGAQPEQIGKMLQVAANLKPLTHSKKQTVQMSHIGG